MDDVAVVDYSSIAGKIKKLFTYQTKDSQGTSRIKLINYNALIIKN